MAKAALIRVDSRLLHGQVVTRWIQRTEANRVIIVNDELAKDSFMAQIYIMAAPPKIKVSILSIDDTIATWNKNDGDKIIFLFKNIETVIEAYKKGFNIDVLQIGGIGGAPGRKVVYKNITLSNEEVDVLEDLENKGVKVILQTVPDDKALSLEVVKEKYFK